MVRHKVRAVAWDSGLDLSPELLGLAVIKIQVLRVVVDGVQQVAAAAVTSVVAQT
jgi:hypothetical protein